MVTDEIRTLVQKLAKAAKETNTSIKEIVELLDFDYSILSETDDSEIYRLTAEKIVSEMYFSLSSNLYSIAVEILCIAYEKRNDIYKRNELAKELAKRIPISEINAYNSLSPIMHRFASYLYGKGLYSYVYVYKHSTVNTDKVLKILVSYIENAFKSKKE